MKILRCFLMILITPVAGELRAAEPNLLVSLIPPAAAAGRDGAFEVQVAVLNPGSREATLEWPETIPASAGAAGARIPGELLRRDAGTTATSQRIAPGGFALRTYTVGLSRAAAVEEVTLEAAFPGIGEMRTALAVHDAKPVANPAKESTTQRPTTHFASARPALEALRRTFADRVGAHEPIYFIYGDEAPGAKFQFSFKYRLLDFRNVAPQRMARSLQFAFTQRSLWDIDAVSSPFFDTSYMPELIYESLAPSPGESDRWFTWLGFQAAFKHESNGRDGPISRSLNMVYARPVLAFGVLERWHLLAIPEVFTYVDTLEDNPDIKEYRGYGRLHLVFGRNDGPALMATLWQGKSGHHGSAQLDLTFPVRTGLLNFETYLLIQYFNGYGESLRSYQEKSETLRAGVSLVR